MPNILVFLKNKYVFTLLILSVWILFFDKNDLATQFKLRKEVKTLEEEKNYFTNEISEITADLKELSTNPKTLEKFAREKYLMKRDNEEIFVIVDETK